MDIKKSHPISLATVLQVGARSQAVLQQARDHIQRPDQKKHPPRFTTAKLGGLVGLDRSQVQTKLAAGSASGLPAGTMAKRRRTFSLEETQHWTHQLRAHFMRPAGMPGCVITLAHFKGGSGKTTTAATIAHGLSRLGHRGLVIDSDPQGSLTTLFGYLPDLEIKEEQTLSPLFVGPQFDDVGQYLGPGPSDLEYAIKSTYWPGIDIIPSASPLAASDFFLPVRQMKEPEIQFWRILDFALDSCREKYDFIIIDTPPSLSYITMNALSAADGIIMPLPPKNLDFASSTQFWHLFGDMQTSFQSRAEKRWAFIDMLPMQVRLTGQSSPVVMEWMQHAYETMVAPVQIPDLEAVRTAAKNFSTVFDAQPLEADEHPSADAAEFGTANVSSRSMQTAVDVFERLALHVESRMVAMWRRMGE